MIESMDNQVICSVCGTNYDPDDRFCSECGTELSTALEITQDTGYNTKFMYSFERYAIDSTKTTIRLQNDSKIQYHSELEINNWKVLLIASSLTFILIVFMGIGMFLHFSEALTIFISMASFFGSFLIVLAFGSFTIEIKSRDGNFIGQVIAKNILKKKNWFFIKSDDLKTYSLKFLSKKQAILLANNKSFEIIITKGKKIPFQVVNDQKKIILEAKSDLSTNYPKNMTIYCDKSFDELLMVFTVISVVKRLLTKTPN